MFVKIKKWFESRRLNRLKEDLYHLKYGHNNYEEFMTLRDTSELSKKVSSLEKEIQDFQDTLENQVNEGNEFSKEIEEFSDALNSMEDELNTLRNDIQDQDNEMQEHNKTIEEMSSELNSLKEDVETLSNDLRVLELNLENNDY